MASTNPAANASCGRGLRSGPGYVSHIGATTSVANFVQPDNATQAPRNHGTFTSQKPKIRKTGTIASFVFDIEHVLRERKRGPRERERRPEVRAAEA